MSTTERDLAADLSELTALPAASGSEALVADWIASRLQAATLSPAGDSLGNLLLLPRGRPPSVLVVAHMDQVAYMVARMGDDRAWCLPLGDPKAGADRPVAVRVTGDSHPPLVGQLEARDDSGGTLRSERLEEVEVGDRVTFANPLEPLDGGRVRGPALDNRVGCAVALHAACELARPGGGVGFAWTVREETEYAGAMRVVRAVEPTTVVAVDITYAAEDGGSGSAVAVGRGPAITLLDGGMVGHGPTVRAFARAAAKLGVGWQREVVDDGVSEAGRVQSLLGVPSIALLVPVENPHSDHETADLHDAVAATGLLVAGVRALCDELAPRRRIGISR